MTSEFILSVLKFAGPVVGLASALWSTTQKITYEAADGVKRLTLQGRVLVGIITMSAVISVLALGLETMIRRQDARDAAKQEEDRQKAALAKETQEKAERDRLEQKAILRAFQADAASQKRSLEERLVMLGLAAEQQHRDAQISMQVASEANRRLRDAERTFAEFERINYPLRSVDAEVVLSLDLGGIDMSRAWRAIEAIAADKWRVGTHGGQPDFTTLECNDLHGYSPLDYAARGTTIKLTFVKPGDAFSPVVESAKDEIRPIEVSPSINGPITRALPCQSVTVDRRRRTMTAHFSDKHELAVAGILPNGDKVSLADVGKWVPVLTIERNRNPKVAGRAADTLTYVSFRLNGLPRFNRSSDLRIAGESAFILAAESRGR